METFKAVNLDTLKMAIGKIAVDHAKKPEEVELLFKLREMVTQAAQDVYDAEDIDGIQDKD